MIIGGDFNMTDQTDDYATITAKYTDSYREVGWGMGFTFTESWFGLLGARLDYVFHGRGLQVVNAQVWEDTGGSNHNPVLVKVAIVDSGGS